MKEAYKEKYGAELADAVAADFNNRITSDLSLKRSPRTFIATWHKPLQLKR